MGSAVASSAPTGQVDALMKQIADENGLEVAAALPAVEASLQSEEKKAEDVLTKRSPSLPARLHFTLPPVPDWQPCETDEAHPVFHLLYGSRLSPWSYRNRCK